MTQTSSTSEISLAPRRRKVTFDQLSSFIFPCITFGTLLLVWELSVTFFSVPEYVFPRVGPVAQALYSGYAEGTIYPHLAFTLQSTLSGYVIGCSLAVIFGAILAESRTFEKFVYPFVIALQSMPKVAVAPLIMLWFGYGIESKIVMVAVICFFPLFVNTIAGIRQTDPAMINMMKAFSAPGWLTFFRVKLFAAAGSIFAGLKISVVMALIGAVVGEFVGSAKGLGWLIQSGMSNFNTPLMFSALITLIVVGLTLTSIVSFFHRRAVYWEKTSSTASN